MKKIIEKLARHIPCLKDLFLELDRLKKKERTDNWAPPGHFYSPIPSIDEVKARENELFSDQPKEIQGINLNEQEQLALFDKFKEYYKEQPFSADKTPHLRFFFDNSAYSYSDGIILHCMIRHLKPKRIIEIGSGYSSCAILDTNELFFDNGIDCTFIEPYPQLLQSLIKPSDKSSIKIIQKKLQDVELDIFRNLEERDILFIDSTHVSKIGSDVNYFFFKILPTIKGGVNIHFHDIFYNFEYPKEWIYEGRAWNENYLLRAFLQYNPAFEIIYFNSFLEHHHTEKFAREMPLCLKKSGGASIWLKKV